MYKFREHKNDIITNIISNLFWYVLSLIIGAILLLIPLFKSIIKNITTQKNSIPIYSIVLAILSILLFIVLIIITIVVTKKITNKKVVDDSKIMTDLKFDSLDLELYFHTRKDITTYLTYDGIVNQEDIEEFSREIIWTGSKYNYTKIIESNGNYSVVDSNRTSSPYKYVIDFDKKCHIGDKIYFKLETSVTDDKLEMNPIFSHFVKRQTDKLTIRLTVPKNLIKNVQPIISKDWARDIILDHTLQIERKNVGNLIQYSLTIDNPMLLTNYCIKWDFRDNS